MEAIKALFEKITQIPHCSGKTERMASFLKSEGARLGCAVQEDGAGNLLLSKGTPKLCLQAHYDMVCVGRAPQVELIEEEGMLRAKESTLGADNGIGVAMALYFLSRHDDLEALFTSDEEIGLVGAMHLELKPHAPRLLNLDSEEEGDIFIGCAGAVEIHTHRAITRRSPTKRRFFRIEAGPYAGGHSGVDIDKPIPNAIKELAFALEGVACELVLIEGGEADNAIPRRAAAVVACDEVPKISEPSKKIEIREITDEAYEVIEEGEALLSLLRAFAHGVRAYNRTLGIVEDSINLATIQTRQEGVEIVLFARSMENGRLERLKRETAACFKGYGFTLEFKRQMPAWRPEPTPFAELLLKVSRRLFPDASFRAIHAGLECGVIQDRIPGIQSASIGPNIYAPHSVQERVELASVYRVARVVEALIEALKRKG